MILGWMKTKCNKELKPCPFCGKVPDLWKNYESGLFKIFCNNENCGVYTNTNEVTRCAKNELINIWNTRHTK